MWLYRASVTFGTDEYYIILRLFYTGFGYARGQMPNTAYLNWTTRFWYIIPTRCPGHRVYLI
jgi:hypothetical protein